MSTVSLVYLSQPSTTKPEAPRATYMPSPDILLPGNNQSQDGIQPVDVIVIVVIICVSLFALAVGIFCWQKKHSQQKAKTFKQHDVETLSFVTVAPAMPKLSFASKFSGHRESRASSFFTPRHVPFKIRTIDRMVNNNHVSVSSDASSVVVIIDPEESRRIHDQIVESFVNMSQVAHTNEQHYPEHANSSGEPPSRKKAVIDTSPTPPIPARRKSSLKPVPPPRRLSDEKK